jgi:hypothetical protein
MRNKTIAAMFAAIPLVKRERASGRSRDIMLFRIIFAATLLVVLLAGPATIQAQTQTQTQTQAQAQGYDLVILNGLEPAVILAMAVRYSQSLEMPCIIRCLL